MKLISLNTWGGRAGKDDLLAFFKKNKDIDIFCLQEMWAGAYKDLESNLAGGVSINYDKILTDGVQKLSELLSEHDAYFRPLCRDNYGLLMFVRKNLEVINEGELYVYKNKGYISKTDAGDHARSIQYVTIKTNNKELITVINFHGLWKKNTSKSDIPERIEQSKKIVKFLDTLENPVVFIGDFNILPEGESIKILENSGYRNLIREYKIQSTRTSYYDKEEKHADYAFVSDGINVNDFKVLKDEVSDHSPLYLDFN